jgi:Cys-Gly metallodipeptidase DUG1
MDAECSIDDQSDNYWLTTKTPAVTYGLRGIMYYKVTVNGPLKDLHSGVYGGMVYEPLAILTKLLASLTSSDGTILVPGVNELVEPLTSIELFVTSLLVNSSDDI